jgi:hypothetical protein
MAAWPTHRAKAERRRKRKNAKYPTGNFGWAKKKESK